MKHMIRIFPLMLCLLLVSVLLWMERNPSSDSQSQEVDGKGAIVFPVVNGEDNTFPNRKLNVMPAAPLKRGVNNVLRHATPVVLEREIVEGKLFSGNVFNVLAQKRPGPLSKSKETLSVVDAEWDQGQLQQLIASDAELITLPLSGGRSVDVKIEKMLSRGGQTVSLQGKDVNNSEGDVLLVFHDGAVFGTVAYYDTNTHFEYASSGDGNVAIRLLNPLAFTAACGQVEENALSDAFDLQGEDTSESFEAVESYDGVDVSIDYVVGYGLEARQAEGGTAAIEAKIIAAVDRTNLAFSNSGLGDEVELVLLGTIEDPSYDFPGSVDGNMGSSDELGNLNEEADGILDTVTDLKNTLGADGAAFVVESADGSAGVAYRPGTSMIVARTYMTSTRITFVHELGHNIGCNHSWGDGDNDLGTSQSNYGWRFTTSSNSQVRTVMAYDWDWTRIPYFSDPNILYEGSPTGAEDGYDASSSTSADSRYESGGFIETAGAGFDGSNPDLGARNADYILARAWELANNAERVAPRIQLEITDGEPLLRAYDSIDLRSDSLGEIVSKTVTVTNVGEEDLVSLNVEIQGEDASSFVLTQPSVTSLATDEATTFQISYSLDEAEQKEALLVVWDSGTSDVDFYIPVVGAVRTELYSESFESDMGIWVDGSGDINWSRDAFGTPSVDTGPSAAGDGSWYLYTEASGSTDSTVEIEADFDLSSKINTLLEFDYHMYGEEMGVLSVDIYSEGSWIDSVWKAAGEQQSGHTEAWRTAVVDLSDYDEMEEVKIRFNGITGSSYRSDMAIDSVKVFGTDAPPEVVFSTWTSEQSLSGEDAGVLATPEGDGIENLLKYAFNMTVPMSGPRVLTPGTGTSGLPYFTLPTETDDRLIVEFLRNSSAADLSYEVVFSSDLVDGGEVSNGVETSVTAVDSDWDRVIVEDDVEVGEASRRFGKVIIELAE